MSSKSINRIGILITNLGTPDDCTAAAVRRYLAEFLSDRRVVELPAWIWQPILRLAILPFRPYKTAHAYRQIWRKGSPLLVISRKMQKKLQGKLKIMFRASEKNIAVELGMRYGNPSIADALNKLRTAGANKILVLPLYPQYCAATTAATFDAVAAVMAKSRRIPQIRFIDNYHAHPDYIAALAHSVKTHAAYDKNNAMLLMSFHGIPQAAADAGDPYPRHCQTTARLLAAALGLKRGQWKLAYQSRFGRAKWLQPYTDETLRELARSGVRNVRVICPGFSADCLETLEEMAIQNRAAFVDNCAGGGESYQVIPCLNDDDWHIRALANIIAANIADWLTLK